jgi:hypothetical protein
MSLGPHEQQLRALREKKAARAARRPTTPPAAPVTKETIMFDTDNAGAVPAPERKPTRAKRLKATKLLDNAKKNAAKKAAAKKAKKKTAKKAKPAKTPAARDGLRAGSKLAIIDGMLRHPGGCTRAEVMKACSWPSVSMQQQASALGVELKSSKEQGQPTRYWID